MRLITREQAREFDRRAIEDLRVPSVCLMENAGRQVADAACGMISEGDRVLILCGTGNNGGDGLVAARHLLLRGVDVEVILLGTKEKLTPDSGTNYTAAVNCSVPVHVEKSLLEAGIDPARYGLIIDALLGTGISGEVREPFVYAIDLVNKLEIPVLAADIPSGLDCNTGRVLGTCVKADRTVTFILKKVGFETGSGPEMCGEVTVADIGVPI